MAALTSLQRRSRCRPGLESASSNVNRSKKSVLSQTQKSRTQNAKSQRSDEESPSSGIKVKQETCPSEIRLQMVTASQKKSSGKVHNVKREQSDIVKSFSKPTPKLNREHTSSSASEIVPVVKGVSVRYSSSPVSSNLHYKLY